MNYNNTKRACYMSYIGTAIANNLAPLLFVIFMDSFGYSYTQIGAMIFINFMTQLTVDALSVRFLDKIGYRTATVTGNICVMLGLIMMGTMAQFGYFALVLAAVVYGLGGGLLEVTVSPIIESLPLDEKSGQMSLLHSFYCWGQVLVVAVTTVVIKLFGTGVWRYLCCAWAIIPALTSLLFTKVPLDESLSSDEHSGFFGLFKHKFFVFALLMMMSAGASELVMAQWVSAFAERAMGISKFVGDLTGSCLFAVFMGTVRALYGFFSEKIKIIPALTASAALCVVCYLVSGLSYSATVSLLACALTGIGVALMWPCMLSLSSERIPDGGTAMFAMLALFGDMGCAFGPWLTGVVADSGLGLNAGILCGVIFPVIMLIGLFAVKKCRS